MEYKDGEPCNHPGCLNHLTHPCEGCGRIAGKNIAGIERHTSILCNKCKRSHSLNMPCIKEK